MRNCLRLALILIPAVCLVGPPLMRAQSGYKKVFNGKDLSGWHKNREKIGHGTGGDWRVENGVIVGEQDPAGSGNGGILLSDAKFGDFEVIFEVMPDWGVDSGFFLRSSEKGECYQIMLDYHEDGNVGEIYREALDGRSNRTFSLKGEYRTPGELTSLNAITATAVPRSERSLGDGKPLIALEDWRKVWKLNAFNEVKARVVGNPPTITTWINGVKITEWTSEQKFEDKLSDTGSIAVQVHGGVKAWPAGKKIRFRNIRVKELK